MTRLGFTDVAVYFALLQEWAADPTNPMVVGTAGSRNLISTNAGEEIGEYCFHQNK